MVACKLCEILKSRNSEIILENEQFIAISDKSPVTRGHTLAVPKKHILSFFDLNDTEVSELYEFLKEMKQILDKKHSPDGYNIGVNDGRAAGRTLDHLHVHLIPRYTGDIENPIGGVRHILGRNTPYEP